MKKLKKKLSKIYWKYKKRILKKVLFHYAFPMYYRIHSKKNIDPKKVVFIEVRFGEITNSFQELYGQLTSNFDVSVRSHFLRSGFVRNKVYYRNCFTMVKDIADAKYIFLNDSSNVIGSLPLRKDSFLMQTWHGCGAFKKFGFSTAELLFGETKEEMQKYPYHVNNSCVSVSSPEVVWAYEEAFGYKRDSGIVLPTGISRTDVFYKQEHIERAKQRFYDVCPQAIGKKVILYAPTFRGRVAKAQPPRRLNVGVFEHSLSDDYILVTKHHPFIKNRPAISPEYNHFAMDVSDSMGIEDLLCVADVVISDYSSLVFEYSLFEKPMIFFAYDLETYFDWRGFYYDYHQLAPGPIFTTNKEMIHYIKHLDQLFDKQKVVEFKNKFMSSCDGQATDRILRTMMKTEYDLLKKRTQ